MQIGQTRLGFGDIIRTKEQQKPPSIKEGEPCKLFDHDQRFDYWITGEKDIASFDEATLEGGHRTSVFESRAKKFIQKHGYHY
jgi:hypothetical protein